MQKNSALGATNYLNGITSNYTYDQLYELTQVAQGASTTESYSYDPVGNRLSSLTVPNYSYNTSNELTSNSTGSYTYDNNGNTLVDASGKGYMWDFENRLVQAVVPGTNGGTTTFKYDPFGKRIQKSGPLGATNYLYDGPSLIEEVDGSGNVLARYTFSRKIDQTLSMIRSGVTSYYEQDGIGSVSALSNPSGGLASTYSYDSFGNLTASTGTVTNPFRYTGREFDSETGIYFYRARYYDPAPGHFMGEDPARFDQGGNFYVYVSNNPVLLIDPTGLAPCCPSANADQIQKDINNAQTRLLALQNTGTALLPTDTGANVGAMTGCLAGGVVKGTNIGIPNSFVIQMNKDPNKDPCGYQCELVHEKTHARQCMTWGATFYSLSEAEREIPAYMMELGCLLKMQMDNGLGPYHQ
jgi:RHS repeat-associated protein